MELAEFINFVDLVDIVVYEERSRRINHGVEVINQTDFQPLIETRLAIHNENKLLGIRFRMLFTGQQDEYVADFEARYSLPTDFKHKLDEALILSFAEEVGYLAVYPFLRTSIYSSASRLGMSRPVLGIARRGDFHASDKMTEAEASQVFFDTTPESSAI